MADSEPQFKYSATSSMRVEAVHSARNVRRDPLTEVDILARSGNELRVGEEDVKIFAGLAKKLV